VRVPNADQSLHGVEPGLSDEQVLFAGDIFATGYDCAAEAQIERGDAVAVIGCGPVGLMAVQAAQVFEPAAVYAVDTVSQRLEMAQTFGAIPVDASAVHAASFIQDHTGGRGADRVLECVGALPALADSLDCVRAGGRISVIGVHSDPEVPLPLSITFVRAIDLKFCGTANVVGRWDDVFSLLESGSVRPDEIISHRLPLSDAVHGYEVFASREALKVVLTP
jgi:threonine dehydrogenase-like Zn-dependent dehydrogenase